MRHKWILVLLAFSSCGFTSRANADFPPRLDSHLLDPNGIILDYGAEDGSLHIYQLPDATPLTLVIVTSATRSIEFRQSGECETMFDPGSSKFAMLNPAGFSDLDCPAGTITSNLSLEFLSADLRIEGSVLGGGIITDAILVPEPSGQLGSLLVVSLVSIRLLRLQNRKLRGGLNET